MGDHAARGEDFEKKAENKLQSSGLFGSKYEVAADLYDKAANSFKLAKSYLDHLVQLQFTVVDSTKDDNVMAEDRKPREVEKPDVKEEVKKVLVHEDIEFEAESNRNRHLNVVFIGYVVSDAGKSTTGGQKLFFSGQVDDRTIQKYDQEAKDKSRES